MGAAHPGAHIDNLATTIAPLQTSAGMLPLTVNDGGGKTCYVCCPTVAYIDYALSELRHFSGKPPLKLALTALIELGRPVVRASGVDRHVQPNNWLLATNPVPVLTAGELDEVTRSLLAAHPSHAVVWRSLNEYGDADKITAFRAAGYDLFPARQIYLFDCRGAAPALHRDEKRDAALLAQDDYVAVLPGPGDHARMAELYGHLYLEKYTHLNPQYSARFMAAAQADGLVEFHGLRNRDGRLDGVIGFFDAGEVMTAPIVGYDTGLPQELGLYRRLMAIGLQRARTRRLLYNMSAGAAGFKRNRGGVSSIEYAAVYTRHLPLRQRAASWVVRTILEKVGATLLTRFEL